MLLLTLLLMGGTSFRFFGDDEKISSAQRHRFPHALLSILSAHFLKILSPSHPRSGDQVRLSDPTSEKVCDATVPEVFARSI